MAAKKHVVPGKSGNPSDPSDRSNQSDRSDLSDHSASPDTRREAPS
jgi:hypothetical protein